MKGIILASFVEFAERELGGAADGLRTDSYSPVMDYPDEELFALVARTSKAAGVAVPDVLRRFGTHLFRTFASLYPVFLDGVESALELLGGIETYVHGEVKKLYPDAEFPSFEVRAPAAGRLELLYRSRRPLADLAEGMIQGCVAHFGERITVRRQDLGDPPDGHAARFTLRVAPKRRSARRGASA
jgi:hypothetical protein